jgi:hypothetical protein
MLWSAQTRDAFETANFNTRQRASQQAVLRWSAPVKPATGATPVTRALLQWRPPHHRRRRRAASGRKAPTFAASAIDFSTKAFLGMDYTSETQST